MKTLPGLRVRMLVVLLLLVLPLSVLVYLEVQSDHEQAMAAARSSAKYMAAADAQRVAALLENTRHVLETLRAAPSMSHRTLPRLKEFVDRLHKENPELLNFGVVDLNGKVLVSAIEASATTNLSDREYFQQAIREDDFAVGDYQVGRITGKPSVACALPLHDENGRTWGVVYAALDVSVFDQALARQALPAGATAILFDDEGRIVARRPSGAGYVGRKVPDWEVVRAAIGGSHGPESIEGVDSVPRAYGFEPAFDQHGQGLFVAVGLDERTLFAGESKAYFQKLGYAALVRVFVIVVAWVLLNLVVFGELRALRDVVRRIAHGDLDARANLPKTGDEIGELAAECDAMASAIGEYVRRIERDEQQSRELAQLLPVGVFVLDAEHVVRFANDTGLRMLGATALPDDGLPFLEYVRAEDRDDLVAHLGAVSRGEAPPLIEICINGARETDVEFAGTPYAEGLVLAVAHDVTERKVVEQLKSDFLSMVSHELRTPLTSITGFAQLLTLPRQGDARKVRLLGGRIVESAAEMTRMVEGLLAVLQAETRSFCGEKRPSDVREIVERCIAALDVPATHAVELTAPRRLRRVPCDPQAVSHAVSNLLANAVKFSPEGGRVAVRISQKDGRTRIDVADQGIGVPEGERERIFERFAQVDMSSTRAFSGFGVGLFIVRQVAAAHDGTAFVEEAPGGGSVFTLELGSVA